MEFRSLQLRFLFRSTIFTESFKKQAGNTLEKLKKTMSPFGGGAGVGAEEDKELAAKETANDSLHNVEKMANDNAVVDADAAADGEKKKTRFIQVQADIRCAPSIYMHYQKHPWIARPGTLPDNQLVSLEGFA
jgi:hypothetical protein